MAKRFLFTLLIITIFVCAAVSPVTADDVGPVEPFTPIPSAETGEMVDETPQLWFVELTSPPTADGTALWTVKAEKAAFRTNARKVGLVYSERYVYHTLFNGFAISIKTDQLSKLNRIPGVKNVYPVGTTPAPEIPLASDPELFTSLAMIGADIAQSELGYTGEGIKVGVIDTGIDYDHSDLGGDGIQRSNSTVFPTIE